MTGHYPWHGGSIWLINGENKHFKKFDTEKKETKKAQSKERAMYAWVRFTCILHSGHNNVLLLMVIAMQLHYSYKISDMTVLCHKRSTMHSIFQISISQNTKCVEMVNFLRVGHK